MESSCLRASLSLSDLLLNLSPLIVGKNAYWVTAEYSRCEGLAHKFLAGEIRRAQLALGYSLRVDRFSPLKSLYARLQPGIFL